MGHFKDVFINTALGVTSVAGIAGDFISQSPQREILPDFYQEQAGNFGLPWCLAVIVNMTGKILELRGATENNSSLIDLGNKIRNYGNAFIYGILIGVEGQFINNLDLLRENASDMVVGLIAITIGINAGKRTADKILHRS